MNIGLSNTRNKLFSLYRVFLSLFLCCLFNQAVFPQIENTKNNPDSVLKSGLSVDPATLGFSLRIPLGSYPGRNGVDVPVVINYSSKVWRMRFIDRREYPRPGEYNGNVLEPLFSEDSLSGWTSSLDVPWIGFDVPDWGYNQTSGIAGNCNNPPFYSEPCFFVSNIFLHLPDGSSHELRKDDVPRTSPDRTGTYYSVDGSNMRFEFSDTTLYLPDGSRYIFPALTAYPARYKALYFVDKDGNKMNYDSAGRSWTDTMGRSISLPFSVDPTHSEDQATGVPDNPAAGDYTYTIKGINSASIAYTFRWRKLADSRTDPNQPLQFRGSNSFSYGNPNHSQPYLFEKVGLNYVCSSDDLFNPSVLSEIVLPNGNSYTFTYNVYGEIDRIVYPSGAYERLVTGYVFPDQSGPINSYNQPNRGVIERHISPTGNPTDEQSWHYKKLLSGSFSYQANPTIIIAPDNTITKYFYYTATTSLVPFGLQDARVGKPREIQRIASDGVTIMSRSLSDWSVQGPTAGGFASATSNSLPRRSVNILFEAGSSNALASMIEVAYDTSGSSDPGQFSALNVKQVKAHNYIVLNLSTAQTADIDTISANFSSATLSRVSEIDYLYDTSYKARGILGLPTETRVLNPTNTSEVLAKSQFVYDEPTYFDNVYTTTNWEDPQSNLRGNVTTARTWNKDTNTWIESHTAFDNFGNVRKVWDTSGDPTRFIETEYDPVYKYAYPTKTKAPAPDPTGVHGTTEGSEITRIYDFNTGLMLSVTDANGQTATTEYDGLLRPIRINPPAGGSTSETIYNDTPGNIWVKRRQQIDDINWAESTTYFDNLGRAFKSRTKDLQGDVMSQVKFDSFGRVEKTSNPYRVDSNGNPTETVYWSKLRYDERNRVVETYAPALESQTGNSLGTVQFGISTLPNLVGTYAVATDASGRKSRAITGIYRLMRVDEATGVGGTVDQDLGTLANPTQPTYYSYNIKGELTKIIQGIQDRYFMYDSLGRLIRVRQPEQTPNASLTTSGNPDNNQWTAGYTYDVFGHVIRFTDARGINVVNQYDKAGRATSRCYTKPNIQTTATQCDQLAQTEVSIDTPQVAFYYDGKGLAQAPQFSKGSLTKVTNGISEHRYTSFDSHRRLLTSQQVTDGQAYDFSYKYNRSGGLLEETYPSGRIVKSILDTDGGLSTVATKSPAGPFRTVAANFDYSPSGAVKRMMLGNGRWETAQYNQLAQITQLGLGSSPTDKSLWKVDYEYGELSTDGTAINTAQNTGSIGRQTTTIPGTSFVQTFGYDSLNRLTEAKERAPNGTENWRQTFGYDRFGNRISRYQKVGDVVLPIDNHTLPTIDQATNRFTTGQGYVYDFNGNLVQDAEGRSFTFDGNDKQIQVTDANQQVVGTYVYDGSGTRVKKVTDSEATVFVYDAAGRLAAEYSTEQNPEPKTSYLTTDHLGSPRVVTDQAGDVTARRDFMPFGEEIYAGVGGRTESLKYSLSGADNIRKRFTGYEKDTETDLDYAQARMYGNVHGRFTAVDPLMASAFSLDPQTLNRYTFTGNNPINYSDPTGLRYYRNQETRDISWFDDNPGKGWEDLTDVRVTITRGGCFEIDKCVVTGDDVTFKEDKSIIYHNRDGGAAIVEIGYAVQEIVVEITDGAAEIAGTESLSFAPSTNAPSTIDVPTGGPGPGGGPLEPSGGSGTDGGTDTGGEVDAGAGGGWKITAAKLLWFLGNACYQTNCWESDDEEEEIELYRGVPFGTEGHPDWYHERFRLALEGTALPRGGHATPAQHNEGDTRSIYTSWTTDISVAEDNAKYPTGGVILTKKFPRSRLVESPDVYEESEVLVVGPVYGASVKWIPRR